MERKEAIERLQRLIGKELHELANESGVAIYRDGKVNKGWAGRKIFRTTNQFSSITQFCFLGIEINSPEI